MDTNLKDAMQRSVRAADIAGIRAILVHALSVAATRFYEEHGFVASPVDPLTLMITVNFINSVRLIRMSMHSMHGGNQTSTKHLTNLE